MCKDSNFKVGDQVKIFQMKPFHFTGYWESGTVLGCHTMRDGRVRVLVDKDDGHIWSGPVEMVQRDYQPLSERGE